LPLLIITGLALLLIAWFVGQPWLAARRRARAQAQPYPPAWRAIVRRRVPLAARMPADLQAQLRKHIQAFLAEKQFIGCQGQTVDDEVRVTIAAQACMLLLNRKGAPFPGLRQVLVYPRAFFVDVAHADETGVVQSGRDLRAGESWQEGQVVVSWEDVIEGAAQAHDGWNVVLHEFAHQLDAETGSTNGCPDLGDTRLQARWTQVLQQAYAQLVRETEAWEAGGPEPFLDPYGASAPAEFFAVLTETFFEQGHALRAHHPELFDLLRACYRVDPTLW
jgi:Mlc titration factor MtfA (ptsG expression regulator)